MIDINIKIDGKEKGGHAGMMGMSLEDMMEDKPVITKKKKKKKKVAPKMPKMNKPTEYATEVI